MTTTGIVVSVLLGLLILSLIIVCVVKIVRKEKIDGLENRDSPPGP